jgi:hypothetical protein
LFRTQVVEEGEALFFFMRALYSVLPKSHTVREGTPSSWGLRLLRYTHAGGLCPLSSPARPCIKIACRRFLWRANCSCYAIKSVTLRIAATPLPQESRVIGAEVSAAILMQYSYPEGVRYEKSAGLPAVIDGVF